MNETSVLVVDDDLGAQRALIQVLKKEGYSGRLAGIVAIALSGAAAWKEPMKHVIAYFLALAAILILGCAIPSA